MADPKNPFDWKSLITPVSQLGFKALGDKLAPSADLQNVQNNREQGEFDRSQTGFQNQLLLAKLAQQNSLRSQMAPGMFTNLGYGPDEAKTMFKPMDLPTSAPGASGGLGYAPGSSSGGGGAVSGSPGLGSQIGRAAVGVGTSVAPMLLGALLHGGGAAAGAAAGAGAGAGAGAAGGGLGATIGGLATNPFTIAAAGALVGGLLWKKSQAHPEANTWVQGEQNPFDQSMAGIDQAASAGKLQPAEAQEAKKKNVQNYLQELQKFSMGGSDKRLVARQALQTFRQWYGEPAQYGVTLSL